VKTKIAVLIAGVIVLLLISALWNHIGLPMVLTDNYGAEMKTALVQFWTVVLDKSIIEDPSKLATVATGAELKHQQSRLYFFAQLKYAEYLKSAKIDRVIEYTPTCSHIEATVEHVSGIFDYHYFFVKEDGVWKVADTYWVLPQPDFAPPDEPTKNCSDFAQ
jgi:hypothetical protein